MPKVLIALPALILIRIEDLGGDDAIGELARQALEHGIGNVRRADALLRGQPVKLPATPMISGSSYARLGRVLLDLLAVLSRSRRAGRRAAAARP